MERNLAARTLESYASDLRQLREFLQEDQIHKPAEIRAVHLARWLQHLGGLGRAASSQGRALSALRQFFEFLVQAGELATNPALELQSPKSRRPLPKILSRPDVARLLDAPDPGTPRGQRDRAALELLYASGLRASELCGLRTGELHLTLGVVRPRGKGSKERVVPMGQAAIATLQTYLGEGRLSLLKGKASPYVFIGNRARPLSRMGLYKLLQRYSLKAGLPRQLSPHDLRHAFATHLLQGGADLRSVQEMLGHADLSTTEIYTHVDPRGLKRAVDTHHPLGSPEKKPPG